MVSKLILTMDLEIGDSTYTVSGHRNVDCSLKELPDAGAKIMTKQVAALAESLGISVEDKDAQIDALQKALDAAKGQIEKLQAKPQAEPPKRGARGR